MIQRLITYMEDRGYRRVALNTEGIYLTYLKTEGETFIVAIMNLFTGEELTVEQYNHILEQIRDNFLNRSYGPVHLLSILCTTKPEKLKTFCGDENTHWILDLTERRLIIYENQNADYLGLKGTIEKFLLEEETEVKPEVKRSRTQYFSLLNTGMAIINILVFTILGIGGFFWDSDAIVDAGALSWQEIQLHQEYYRVLTSMFLHLDLEHLVNNMVVLLFMGSYLEKAVGKLKYIMIYLGSGILAGIASISYNMMKDSPVSSIGASGAIFGVVGAMVVIIIVNKGRLEDLSTRQILIFAVLSIYSGIQGVQIDNVAHIGGFVAGLILALILYRKTKHMKSE
ncbi:MAG: hypothetical protein K0S47_3890 [Herbinix sp.]|jgi:rhomboid protease GluP|nr:hypothetical protein [Herbinix sp.]